MSKRQSRVSALAVLAVGMFYISGCLVAAAGAGAFAGYAWKDKERNTGEILKDAKTTNAIKWKLQRSKEVRAAKLNVDTHLMHVIIAGFVPCHSDKAAAERIAWEVKGVVHVENILVVKNRGNKVDCSAPPKQKKSKKGKAKGHSKGKAKGKAKGHSK